MKKILQTVYVCLGIGLASACVGNTESRVATEVALGIAQTQQISELETAAADAGQLPEPQESEDRGETPESSDTPTVTVTPTITLTPTTGIPVIKVSQDTNCRNGPASSYTYLTTANPGVSYEVVGLWDGGNDYVVIDAGSYDCWLWTRYADERNFPGYDLPSYPTPATPTPAYSWNGNWEIWVGAFHFPAVNFTQNGNSFSYSNSAFGVTVTNTGTTNENFQIVTGTWENTQGTTGTFGYMIKAGNTNQFVGSSTVNGGITNEVCGARNGASKPSPCQWP